MTRNIFKIRKELTISIFFIYSTESGWDNPFRPGGDLSREADEIVNMIKGKLYGWKCYKSSYCHVVRVFL